MTFSLHTNFGAIYQVALIHSTNVGETPVVLTADTLSGTYTPVFKSDGSGIIYVAARPDLPVQNNLDLYSIDLNGANVKRLTDNPELDFAPSVTAATASTVVVPTPTPTPTATLQANSDFYTYNANPRNHSKRLGVLLVSAPGILANDQVNATQTVRLVLVTKPSSKSVYLSMRPDGSFYFITNKRGAQTFTFTYRIINGNKTSNTATVTISAATR